MRIAQILNRPEYFFRPWQVFKRLTYRRNSIVSVGLPNGLPITVDTGEDIGRSIVTQGTYDLIVSEAIARLLEPGELAIDVGANIGYMTAIMAHRVGVEGGVVAFEPHPAIHTILVGNVTRWRTVAPITLANCAVSKHAGRMSLHIPKGSDRNSGLASLNEIEGEIHTVQTVALDDYFDATTSIALLKIDVEGHELAVLEGGQRLLRSMLVRDVIFEDHGEYPGAASCLLGTHGFEVFRLSRSFSKPVLLAPCDVRTPRTNVPLNYLATRDPERAQQLFRKRGWRSLRTVAPVESFRFH
jgi:FkbM family methyltransferase